MPANLPPTYHEAENRFRSAVTPQEKIAALEEMLRIIPKHKGTDKLQADLKSRISKLRRAPTKKAGGSTHSHMIPHEGAAQIVLVGPPNSGKSALVERLTHATPEVADYPFTTREAIPGMMPYLDVAFQLIDLPALSEQHVDPWVFDLIRAADMIWMVLDENDTLEGVDTIERLLAARAIEMVPVGAEPPDEEERRPGWTYQPTLMVATGMDREGAADNLAVFDELTGERWTRVPVSSLAGTGLEELGEATFRALDIIRVYTKQPGKHDDDPLPFALTRGQTVADLARTIHKDLEAQFKFARIWGRHVHDGQTVHRDHELHDGDVVEIHT